MHPVLLFITVFFGVGRIAGQKGDVFKDFAHLWTGGLFGAYLATSSAAYLCLAVALSLLELACFLIFRHLEPKS